MGSIQEAKLLHAKIKYKTLFFFFCPLEVLLHGRSWIYTVFNKTLVATRDLNM